MNEHGCVGGDGDGCVFVSHVDEHARVHARVHACGCARVRVSRVPCEASFVA
jgi:hypothetical protein